MNSDGALKAARAADRKLAVGEPIGALEGLPLVVKDNINTLGFPTSAGTRALKAFVPRHNAPVWQRLLDEGAILLAKANMHELAAGSTFSNPVFGVVHNPHDVAFTPGGSSGGTAAAIAAGLAPAGLGTDTVGSVPGPASFCGVAGMRPSTAGRKAWDSRGVVPLRTLFDTIGPMRRQVEDLALLHQVVIPRVLMRGSSCPSRTIYLPEARHRPKNTPKHVDPVRYTVGIPADRNADRRCARGMKLNQ